ncbi:MAG TPA: substrate-binding domain-containing protein [Nocardioidaceae bacterium]|nr:substrate-binding domain-containing protein [Nocardioidaceae bacterium]
MRHGIRRRLALAGTVLLAGSSAACGAYSGGATETVTLAVPERANPFFQELRAGAEAAADTVGVRLEVVGARNDAQRQARQLRQAVRNGAEAVLVTPVAPDEAGSAVREVLDADIPVVAVDREVEGAPVQSTVTSDNVDGGMQAAHAVATALDGQGQVIHLQGDPQTSVSVDRGAGFEQGIAQYAGIDLATKQPAYFDRREARKVTTRLLRAYPDANAVFAENDQMALGAIDALGDRAGTEVKVVGYDGIPAALEAIQEGTMAATVAQVPEQLGRVALEQAVTAIDGGAVASRVPVGVELVTADNVGQYL